MKRIVEEEEEEHRPTICSFSSSSLRFCWMEAPSAGATSAQSMPSRPSSCWDSCNTRRVGTGQNREDRGTSRTRKALRRQQDVLPALQLRRLLVADVAQLLLQRLQLRHLLLFPGAEQGGDLLVQLHGLSRSRRVPDGLLRLQQL
ncbi:hypothetical protein EYF80_016222 [Liparis tanakae]|uniref:Uncharacterized protein n=1 Tax=Liparis tanakae TaxID=230148 RepID=A0A4Z2I6F5_9TELE|nr:hypothetical protein EYF80_016222 [Liparis tanakae]